MGIFYIDMDNRKAFTQYFCAVVLIMTSIAIAIYEVMCQHDIAGGVLMYIAQAFLLAASIFGLDYYVKWLMKYVQNNK